MDMKMFSYDEEFKKGNATFPPGLGDDNQSFNASFICSDQDWMTNILIRPRVVATIQTFVNACVPRTEKILSEGWNLCTERETFDCKSILDYTSACYHARHLPKCPTSPSPPTPAPCGINQMMGQSDGVLMLIGILALGVLIGVASTIAVFLIFPKIHSWMLSKVQTTVEISRERSYKTHYSDIDDGKVIRDSQKHSNDMALYSVSNINSNFSGPNSPEYESGEPLCNIGQSGQYEILRRGDAGQVSRKYDAMKTEDDTDACDTERNDMSQKDDVCSQESQANYFVLEKS